MSVEVLLLNDVPNLGQAGATVIVDPEANLALFWAEHMLNPHEEFYQPRLRNVLYRCL